jgi:hypothetical protein
MPKQMNETITYEWSEALGMSACMAAHAAKGIRLWLMAVAGIILSTVGWWSYACTKEPFSLVAGLLGFGFLLLPLRIYLLYRRLVKDSKRLLDDPKVSVLINDKGLTLSSGQNTQTIEWTKTTEIVDKQGFLLLYCGKLNRHVYQSNSLAKRKLASLNHGQRNEVSSKTLNRIVQTCGLKNSG